MMLRVVAAGLLVGIVGLAGLAAALGVEHLTAKQVASFLTEHPEVFSVPPNTATLGLLGVTLWLGVAFGFVFHRAFPDSTQAVSALRFGALCGLGLVAPVAALNLLWTPLPLAGIAATLGGWLVQLLGG
ncbi:MAG: hypothetical protein ACE5HL_11410, partial [Terriglobia bacterium]